MELPPPTQWPLHLKDTTLADLEAIQALPTARETTKPFLQKALRYMRPEAFLNLRTSRTVKYTLLSSADLQRAVEMGKFERCDPHLSHPFPEGVHGVNVFSVREMKGRRRLITEPHLNGVIRKCELPKVDYPSRLQRRQELRNARYMLQIDFEAYYDAIPLPQELRNMFVFRTREGLYRLKTLPTGARWSVAVGQAITWTIVDIDTPVTIITMIDNILIAASIGQEAEFCAAVRLVLDRIRTANLRTSPEREWLARKTDQELLNMSMEDSTFLGEEYHWLNNERVVRNSVKTLAKLSLALQAPRFSCRSFASVISLAMYALHTTRLNPARAFSLLRAYRGVYRQVERGRDWDEEVPYIAPNVRVDLANLGADLLENPWWEIAPPILASYRDEDYDVICFTDASAHGWGALVKWRNGATRAYQQRWIHDLQVRGSLSGMGGGEPFTARYSAHAEPRAITVLLRRLLEMGLSNHSKVAIATDHFPVVHAQRRANGFGGIGRGYALNRLFELTNELFHSKGIQVSMFYIAGPMNPADTWSRNFGEDTGDRITEHVTENAGIPLLKTTYSPLCERESGQTMGVPRA